MTRRTASDAHIAGLVAAFDAELARIRGEEPPPEDADTVDGVRRLLAALVEADQYARRFHAAERGFDDEERRRFQLAMGPRGHEVDRRNTELLKALVMRRGWPVISRYGRDAADAAWLLVQHADADLEFQKAVLGAIGALVPAGEVGGSHYAYLHDRVAVSEGRPQRFGTQGRCAAPGAWEPFELEDAPGVDARRADVGLGPLAEYAKSLAEACR